MHLGGAGLAQHADECTLGIAADDGIIHHDELLAVDDLAQRVELQADAELTQGLGGLDESASHISVFDQAVGEGNAGFAGIAHGGRVAGFRNRDDQVRALGRVFAGQAAANVHTGGIDGAALDIAIRAGQVDVLEDAAMALGGCKVHGADASLIDGDELARFNLADELSAADIERTGLGGHHPALGQAAEDQRAHAVRVARGVHGVTIGKGQAECALHARKQVTGGVEDGGVFIHAVGKQHRQAHRVRYGLLVRLN